MSRRRAIAALPMAGLILWAVQACGAPVDACAAPTPTPALRMAPADQSTSRPRPNVPKAPRTTSKKPPKQHPKSWGAHGKHHDDDDWDDYCDDDD